MKRIAIIAQCRSGHSFVRNQIESWTNGTIINHEDLRPINYTGNTANIIVVRDLLNWWASYLKWITKDGIDSYLCTEKKLNNAFSIWLDIAKETCGITNYIPNKIIINYDIFKESQFYREYICIKVGGSYNELRLDTVVSSGLGSSFDYQDIPGTELKSDLRYKQIMDSDLKDLYVKMLRMNKQSIDLYTKYFVLSYSQQILIDTISIDHNLFFKT